MTGDCEVTWRGLRVKQPPIINYALINNEQKICIEFRLVKWKLPILPVVITHKQNCISLLIHIVFLAMH